MVINLHAPPSDLHRTMIAGVPLRALENAVSLAFPEFLAVSLFGSYARSEATRSSDLDLLIVLPPDAPIGRELYDRWEKQIAPRLKSSALHSFSPQFVRLPSSWKEAGSLWFEVALEGIILLKRDLQTARLLSEIRAAIATGLLVRKESHGHPYWVRVAEAESEK